MTNFRKLSFENRTFSTDGQCFLLEELAEQTSEDNLAYILDALKEGLPSVRACAARVLSRLPPENDVVSGLIMAMSDYDARVRQTAVESLCLINPVPVSAIPALLEALDDEDSKVREVALLALSGIQEAMTSGAERMVDQAVA